MKYLILLIILIILFVGCTNLQGEYLVTKVIDGDTVILNNSIKIRFLGIDAPELLTNDCYAKEAKEFLNKLLLNQNIYLEGDEVDKDRYGRLLRYVYLNETNINFILVREGYARAYNQFANTTEYYSEIKKLERVARNNKKGLWNCKNLPRETIIVDNSLF